MSRRFIGRALVLAAALAIAPAAQAAPITGTISFGGDGAPIGSANWYQSTGVSFINPWVVTARSGDYSSVPIGTATTFTNINWGSGSGVVNVPLSQQIWTFTFGAATFSMTGTMVDNILRGSALNNSISVDGLGMLSITGFDPTPGVWNFTGGFAGTGANLSFSSSPAPTIPEPMSMMLLGSGLVGLAGAARRRFRRN